MERTVVSPTNYDSNFSWKRSAAIEYLSIVGLAVIGVIVCGVRRRGRGHAARVFGACWFAAGFLPISNLVELNATVAEHWLYLPSVGFLIFIAGCAADLPVRFRKGLPALAILAVIALSARSFIRSGDWVDGETFYRRSLAAGGNSSRLATNLGRLYAMRGDNVGAERIFRRVLENYPDFPLGRSNLAMSLIRQGKQKEAEAILVSATNNASSTRKEYTRTWTTALNLGRLMQKEGKNAGALKVATQARRDYPDIWEIIRFNAELLRQVNGPEAALTVVEAFAQRNWWRQEAFLMMGQLHGEKGDIEGAIKILNRAAWLDIHDGEALNMIAHMRMGQNRFQEAYEAERRAIRRQPDRPRDYALLSSILEKLGRNADAEAAMTEATRLATLVPHPVAVN